MIEFLSLWFDFVGNVHLPFLGPKAGITMLFKHLEKEITDSPASSGSTYWPCLFPRT